ncbi:MFS transporter [Orbaceae bacterium ac157xtp]
MKNLFNINKITVISLSLIPFTALCVVTLLYIFLSVVGNLSISLKTTPENIAQLTTCFGFFYAFGFLIWGVFSDIYGRRRIIIFGLLSLSVVTFLLSLFSNYGYLLLVRGLQGFFASSFPPVILAWLAENLSDKYRKIAISLISCAFLLAGTLGQWFGVTLIHSSINLSMYILAIIYLISGLIFYFITKNMTDLVPIRQTESVNNLSVLKVFVQIPQVFLERKLIKIYASALFVLMSFVSLYLILNSNNKSSMIELNQLRQIATLGMLNSLFSSWLFSKITVTKVLASSLLVMSITLALQYFIFKGYMQQQIIFFIIHYIYISSIAFAIPAMITCASMFSTQKNRGVAVSLYTCILFVGASLGSFLPNCINIDALFILIIIALFLIGLSVIKLRKG